MNVFFDSCHSAIECAESTKKFGLYYSEKSSESQSVHVHDCCEIFLCLSGGNSFLIDDKVYNVSPDELFIINQFEAHKVSSKPCAPFVRYSLHIHPSFIYSESSVDANLAKCFYGEGKLDCIKLNAEQRDMIISLFNTLSKDYGFGDETYKRLRVTEILLEVAKLSGSAKESAHDGVQNEALELAISYINDNFSSKISLDDVARHAFISVNQLCMLFKKNLSTTVTKFITGKRISEAKKLLSSGKSVTEAGFSAGFNDYANFIRVFKNSVGISPGKFKAEAVKY